MAKKSGRLGAKKRRHLGAKISFGRDYLAPVQEAACTPRNKAVILKMADRIATPLGCEVRSVFCEPAEEVPSVVARCLKRSGGRKFMDAVQAEADKLLRKGKLDPDEPFPDVIELRDPDDDPTTKGE